MKKLLLLLLSTVVLLTACQPGAPPDRELVIYHFNDTHSRVEEGRYAGMGLAKLAGFIEQEKETQENILILDAGDTFHGQTIATLTEGASIAQIMNVIGVDAMAPGNHDFNYGQDRLMELDEETQYPFLSANILKEGEPIFTPYIIKDYDGLKVAIFGLTTAETSYKTHPANVEGLDFADPVEIAAELVPQLRKEAHVIIALTHLGMDESSEDTSHKLAQEVPGIDLIVDGHSHTELPQGFQVGSTLIVQAGEYDKNLGKVELSLSQGELNLAASLIGKEDSESMNPSQAVEDIISEISEELEEITSQEVGNSQAQLQGERADVRTGETNLGNLIADAILEATGADVVITNGGGIRASIAPGVITVGDIITVLPFGNYVVSKEVSGADILAALEHGISDYPEPKGAFPHVAGMTVKFNPSQPSGMRVSQVLVNGSTIDPTAKYILATNDFVAAGGDDYIMFADDSILGEFQGLDEIVIEYISKRGSVSPQVDGRMVAQ